MADEVVNKFPLKSTGESRNWTLPDAVSPVVETLVTKTFPKVGFWINSIIVVPVADGSEIIKLVLDASKSIAGMDEVE